MKTTKSVLAIFLALLMAFSTLTFMASAENPKITDIKWNDDYSVEFSFDGAAKYSWNVYVNGYMVWGYGTNNTNTVTREKMLPYLMVLSQEAIKQKGYSGNVSFDFVIYAKNSSDNYISSKTIVSKTMKIEDVAAGKLAPDTETWKYYPVDTSDAIKLRAAMYAAYDPDQAKIQSFLSSTGITYHQYIDGIISSACKEEYFTFKGTLAQTMRFGSFYSSYAYTDVMLVPKENPDIKVSEVNITLIPPEAGQKINAYTNSAVIKSETEGVTARFSFDSIGAYELDTNTFQQKFYSKNSYEILFDISFEEGYAPAENLVVNVNGSEVDWCSTVHGFDKEINGYYCAEILTVNGNFFNNIATFFHNIIMKIKYPHGTVS